MNQQPSSESAHREYLLSDYDLHTYKIAMRSLQELAWISRYRGMMHEPLGNTEHTERLREGQREHTEDDPPGIVIVVDQDKRYGIIKTVAGRDVYFTDDAVLHDDFVRIEISTAVRYDEQPTDDGPRASTVEIVEKDGQAMAKPSPKT